MKTAKALMTCAVGNSNQRGRGVGVVDFESRGGAGAEVEVEARPDISPRSLRCRDPFHKCY